MSSGTFFSIISLGTILGHVCPDIISSSTSESLLSIARKPCQVPHSKKYYFMSFEDNELNPNDSIDGSGKVTVNVKCFSNSKEIKPVDFAVCFDGQWFPSQHTCVQKKCKPLPDTYSTLFTCTSAKGIVGKCDRSADPGTKVTIQCANWRYTFNEDGPRWRHTSCLKRGEWEAFKKCKPKCGLDLNTDNSRNEYNSDYKDIFPLSSSAVIFHFENGEWNHVCVGTIISTFGVITSYNCFQGKDWNKIGRLSIGVGKYSRNHGDYPPSSLYLVVLSHWNDQHTIGVLTVDRYIAFSNTVGSVCTGGHYDNDTGIGLIVVHREIDNSTVLEETKSLPLSTNKECKFSKMISEKIQSDEFCSLANNHTFTPTDIGTGVIRKDNNGRFIVLGILSAFLLDGRIPVFLNISTKLNEMFIDLAFEKTHESVIDYNEYWFLRREGDSK